MKTQVAFLPFAFLPTAFGGNPWLDEWRTPYGLPPVVVPRHRTTHFGHIFKGHYSAAYDTCLWALVLDYGLFSVFEATGDVWNRDLAVKFRETFLERGGTKIR